MRFDFDDRDLPMTFVGLSNRPTLIAAHPSQRSQVKQSTGSRFTLSRRFL